MSKIVCYYGSWATYREGFGKFSVSDIDATKCTHVIYAFAKITESGNVEISDHNADVVLGGIKKAVALKEKNSKLKVLIAIGGDKKSMSHAFKKVSSDRNLRSRFAQNVLNFIQQYKLSGVDIDWEFPGKDDEQNFVLLMKELWAVLGENYYVTAAVGNAGWDGYDVSELNDCVDFFNIMAYDFYGSWNDKTMHHAPLFSSRSAYNKDWCVDGIIRQWKSQGATPSKLVLGLPFYGRSFKLESARNQGMGAPAIGAGTQGRYTKANGILSYLEVKMKIENDDWSTGWDDVQKVPYAFCGDQWVGYDNERSIKEKISYAKNKSLGGVMIWPVENDDIRSECRNSSLLKAIHQYI